MPIERLNDQATRLPHATAPLANNQDHLEGLTDPNGRKAGPSITAHFETNMASRPVMIRRGEGQPLEALAIDGTSKKFVEVGKGSIIAGPGATTEQAMAAIEGAKSVKGKKGVVATAPVAVAVAAPSKPKTKVTIGGAGMGKMTVFCNDVVVNEHVIVLSFSTNGDVAIVEPPVTDSGSPVLIGVNDKTYKCIYGEWSFTLDNKFFIVLVIVSE